MDTPRIDPFEKSDKDKPPFGLSVNDFYELLDLLAIVFQAMATADGPKTLQARMMVASTVFRDKYGMDAARADVFLARLRYNAGANYGQRAKSTIPLLQRRDWNDDEQDEPRTPPRRRTGR